MQPKIRDMVMQDETLRIEANREIVPRFRGSFQKNIDPSHKDIVALGELGVMILENFFLCEGVTRVTVHSPYGFTVEKGLAFSWDNLRRELRDALSYCLHYGTPRSRELHLPPESRSRQELDLHRDDRSKKSRDS